MAHKTWLILCSSFLLMASLNWHQKFFIPQNFSLTRFNHFFLKWGLKAVPTKNIWYRLLRRGIKN